MIYCWLPKKLKLCDKSGINGSIIRLYQRLSHRIRHRISSSLGASGATSALSMLSILTYGRSSTILTPRRKTILERLGFILAASLILSDLIPLVSHQIFGRDRDDNIDYGAHLGGYIFGLVVWWITINRRSQQSSSSDLVWNQFISCVEGGTNSLEECHHLLSYWFRI